MEAMSPIGGQQLTFRGDVLWRGFMQVLRNLDSATDLEVGYILLSKVCTWSSRKVHIDRKRHERQHALMFVQLKSTFNVLAGTSLSENPSWRHSVLCHASPWRRSVGVVCD